MASNIYEIYTLFDITYTGTKRSFNSKILPFSDNSGKLISNFDEWNNSRNQQRNFDTVIQLLGLRTQIVRFTLPTHIKNVNLEDYEFGNNYNGVADIWRFTCEFDPSNTLTVSEHPITILVQDFDKIPMISGLSQIFLLHEEYFCTTGQNINIYFKN